jgi:hypothetical protein
VREGSGTGEVTAASPGLAHEFAAKTAETDATKRALSTSGPTTTRTPAVMSRSIARTSASVSSRLRSSRDSVRCLTKRRNEPDRCMDRGSDPTADLHRCAAQRDPHPSMGSGGFRTKHVAPGRQQDWKEIHLPEAAVLGSLT